MLLKTSTLALAFALAIGSGAAFAAGTTATGKPLTAQQEKMKSCNADAKTKGLKGAEYTAFRNTCLKGSSATETKTSAAADAPAVPATNAKATQQEKMKTCNAGAKAKGLKGKDYSEFRNNCLKSDTPTASAH